MSRHLIGSSRALLAFALSLPLAPHAATMAARAEDTAPTETKPAAKAEAAPTSVVAGIVLSGAKAVTDKDMVSLLSTQLKTMADQAQLPLGAPEAFSWGGKNYKGEQARALIQATTDALKAAGFSYSLMGKPVEAPGSTTTVFTAISDAQKKMLLGYWVQSETMLLLVWAPLEVPADPAPQAPPPTVPKDAPARKPAPKQG